MIIIITINCIDGNYVLICNTIKHNGVAKMKEIMYILRHAALFTLPVASVTMVTSLFSETSAACNDNRR